MFSIIIVHYKVPELLVRCLQSIRNANGTFPVQVIVIDNDTSACNQSLFVSEYPEIDYMQSESNIGFAAAVNKGIQYVKFPFVLLLNPDSTIHPDALERFHEFYQGTPAAGITGGQVLNADRSFQKQCFRNFPSFSTAFFRLFFLHRIFPWHRLARKYEAIPESFTNPIPVEAVSGAFMCFPMTLMEKIGYFDEAFFLFGEDLDYSYRSHLAGYVNYFIPGAVSIHLRGASRRKRPLKTLYDTHYAMIHFFRKHHAGDHVFLINLLIYSAIWTRWILLLPMETLRMMFGGRGEQ